MLCDTNPEYQYLTREVNTSTNVFPSLHTSLSATVAAFAWQTRSEFPKWLPVAVVLAASVAISTMYLGIHWESTSLRDYCSLPSVSPSRIGSSAAGRSKS